MSALAIVSGSQNLPPNLLCVNSPIEIAKQQSNQWIFNNAAAN